MRWRVTEDRKEKCRAILAEKWTQLSDIQRYHLMEELHMENCLWYKVGEVLQMKDMTDLQFALLAVAVTFVIEGGLEVFPDRV